MHHIVAFRNYIDKCLRTRDSLVSILNIVVEWFTLIESRSNSIAYPLPIPWHSFAGMRDSFLIIWIVLARRLPAVGRVGFQLCTQENY